MLYFREQRIAAMQEALENNFKISIKQYHLSSQAKQLLKQHNITTEIFASCVGNAIQQQVHAEFVAVLNNGAQLYTEKDGLPGVTSLLDATWLQTLGSISCAGVRINLIGRYQLTFTLADMCHGIYEIGKNEAYYCHGDEQHIYLSPESILGSCLECVKRVSKNTGDAVVDFTAGVSEKAFARPAQVIAEFVDLLQYHPDVVYEHASWLLLNTVHCIFDAIKLSEATIGGSSSEQAIARLDEFQENWAGPLREKIVAAADVFWQMPRKEKSQELVALGLQIATVIVAVKTIAAAPAGIAMLNTGVVLQAEELAHFIQAMLPGGGGGQAGVNPGGTVSFVAEAVQPFTETLAAVAGKVSAVGVGVNAGLSVVADAIGTFVLAARDGIAQGVSGRVSAGNTRIVKKVKLRPPKEIRKRYKNLKSKSPEVQGSFDASNLADYPKRLKFTQRVAKHVFEGKVKIARTASGEKEVDISGFHSDYKGQASRNASVKIKTNVRHSQTGASENGIIVNGGEQVEKTMFSERLTPEEVWDMGIESVGNVTEIIRQGKRFLYQTVSKNGTKIMIVSEADGEVVTFFPKAFTENFGKR